MKCDICDSNSTFMFPRESGEGGICVKCANLADDSKQEWIDLANRRSLEIKQNDWAFYSFAGLIAIWGAEFGKVGFYAAVAYSILFYITLKIERYNYMKKSLFEIDNESTKHTRWIRKE